MSLGHVSFFHILAARLAVDRLPRSPRLQPSIRETALDYILSSYSSDRGLPYSVRYYIIFALVVSRSCLIYSCDTGNRVSHSFFTQNPNFVSSSSSANDPEWWMSMTCDYCIRSHQNPWGCISASPQEKR